VAWRRAERVGKLPRAGEAGQTGHVPEGDADRRPARVAVALEHMVEAARAKTARAEAAQAEA
jgi:hypothetical protein